LVASATTGTAADSPVRVLVLVLVVQVVQVVLVVQ
jgi:hypothetical protein